MTWIACWQVRTLLRWFMKRSIWEAFLLERCSCLTSLMRNRNILESTIAFKWFLFSQFFSCLIHDSFITTLVRLYTTTWNFVRWSCIFLLITSSGMLILILLLGGIRPCCNWWPSYGWSNLSRIVVSPYPQRQLCPWIVMTWLSWNIGARCDTFVTRNVRFQYWMWLMRLEYWRWSWSMVTAQSQSVY